MERGSQTGDLPRFVNVHEMLNQPTETASCIRRLLEHTNSTPCLRTSFPRPRPRRHVVERRAHAVELLAAHAAEGKPP